MGKKVLNCGKNAIYGHNLLYLQSQKYKIIAMLSNFLSKTRPINYLMILTLLLIFFFIVVFSDSHFTVTFSSIGKLLIRIVILFFTVFLMNFIIRKNALTKDNSYALYFLVMFFVMFPSTFNWSTVLVSHLFLLLSWRRVYSLKNNGRISIKIFDAGFWLGISVLLNNHLLLFWLVLFMGLVFYKRLNLRNILISIMGLLIPVFLYYVYCLSFDLLPHFLERIKLDYHQNIYFYHQLSFLIPISILISLLIWSIISITLGVNIVNAKNKSSWFLILFQLMIALLISFISIQKNGNELLYLFFPAAIILANYVQKERDKWFKNLVLYLVILVGISRYFL